MHEPQNHRGRTGSFQFDRDSICYHDRSLSCRLTTLGCGEVVFFTLMLPLVTRATPIPASAAVSVATTHNPLLRDDVPLDVRTSVQATLVDLGGTKSTGDVPMAAQQCGTHMQSHAWVCHMA